MRCQHQLAPGALSVLRSAHARRQSSGFCHSLPVSTSPISFVVFVVGHHLRDRQERRQSLMFHTHWRRTHLASQPDVRCSEITPKPECAERAAISRFYAWASGAGGEQKLDKVQTEAAAITRGRTSINFARLLEQSLVALSGL